MKSEAQNPTSGSNPKLETEFGLFFGCFRFSKLGRLASGVIVGALTFHSLTAHGASLNSTTVPKESLARRLDAPLLFVKRHPYFSDHIYDDYYTWHPGGGIYIIEDPSAPQEYQRVCAVIDPTTAETLGTGVYRDPDISWDGKRILFAFKGEKDGDTSIYEIGVDGRGLRRITSPGSACVAACTQQPPPRALGKGRHDISPAYLPDGRIVFTSTREASRVPCFNSEVDILHVMNADGSDIHPISVNNVTEFDPAVMPDGRILYGRWEYVDKTALYMQSLWTCNPDGSDETAFFGNNMAKPTAFLDARPVPGTHLVVASLTPHNGQSVGAVAAIDTHLGKNGLQALFNFTPEYPTAMDQGLRQGPCDPWPLDGDTVLISNNGTNHNETGRAAAAAGSPAPNFPHAVLQIVSRDGRREVIHAEPTISCYSPMLVKARKKPPVIEPAVKPGQPAAFFVRDVYAGLTGVQRGEVASLRVVEETSRISGIPDGGRWWNQAFLVSWQGSYTVKNFLGIVPVHADGSAYFEAPPGRALYFQALDRQGRMLQSMRTFVQASPGVTRSCIGCHENKDTAPFPATTAEAQRHPASQLQPERWGSGYIDYATMIQPVLDRHCVSCHGGEKGIAAGLDLSGGWTWAFNISYESLLKNTLVGFLNCVNEAVKTSEILPARTHGSGAAPLARLLFDGHENRIPRLTIAERGLFLAWMDGNCNYFGTWNWSENATCDAILGAGSKLATVMERAGCVKCHKAEVGNDWVNLQNPELSRILRAPLSSEATNGLAWCRDRKAPAPLKLVKQTTQPPDVFNPVAIKRRDTNGAPVIAFSSPNEASYREMLDIIQRARTEALAAPRVDIPGALIHPGECRQLAAAPMPKIQVKLSASVEADGAVTLSWLHSAELIGLNFELHRSPFTGFTPNGSTRIHTTPGFHFTDLAAPEGDQHYALVMVTRDGKRSAATCADITVPPQGVPLVPVSVAAIPRPGEIDLEWIAPPLPGTQFEVFRAGAGSGFEKISPEPVAAPYFTDSDPAPSVSYRYAVRAITRRGVETPLSTAAVAVALPEPREPVFIAMFRTNATGQLSGGTPLKGTLAGAATVHGDSIDLRQGGCVTYAHQPEFNTKQRFSVECWVRFDEAGEIPVVLSCGKYDGGGWFIQRFNNSWRWHVGGINCDGGEPATNRWYHLVATYDGRQARLFQDGAQVARQTGQAHGTWSGPLFVGQYGAEPGPKFQACARIAGVKIYRRALPVTEISAAASVGHPAKESL